MIQLKTDKKRKQIPPLNKVQLGVQMRLTMGQIAGDVKEQPQRNKNHARREEAADGLPGRRSHEPLPGEEAQDHGAQRGDEAQRQVAALVEHERVLAREQVQEPNIEGLAEVAVLVPVGAKAGVKMMPIRGDSNRGVVEVRAGQRIERPGQPVSKKDGAQRDPLLARRAEGQQKQEGVPQADLGERVFKGEVGLAAVEGAEEDAQQRSAAAISKWYEPAFWEIELPCVGGS